MLDEDLDAADGNVQNLLEIPQVFAENHFGIGENLERAAIGDLEARVAVRTGDDGLLRLDGVVREQGLQTQAAQSGHLAHLLDHLGAVIRKMGLGEAHGGGDCRQQYTHGPRERIWSEHTNTIETRPS